ncbi:MAG: DEAD/DEAH box helicase family protein [Bacteriovoracales bacterium]|nr:DEAD/DEAH box helicase family protein [Bacteriovoracales bacterium]
MPSRDFQRVLNHIRQTSKNPKEKGSRFEKVMLDFFKWDSRYKGEFKNVWLWMDYPNRNSRDLGIDLVGETYSGDYIAIQCKCYQERATLKKENIDSFLNELGKKEFQSGIIVSTTDIWSDNAEKSLSGRSKKCVRIGVSELEESDIPDWWALYKNTKASKPSKKKLRPHQTKALDSVVKGFRKADRGKLIMPCGTGKTFTALKITEKMTQPNARTLILMPSLSLVSQTHREFMQNATKEINAFIVCSDKKAGRDSEDIGVMDLALPPTTDSKQLAKKLKSASKSKNKINVIFSTYHSIEVIAKAQKEGRLDPFDLIVCDEAHRTTGVESRSEDIAKKSYWVQVHKNDFIKADKRLYMTATPRVYTEKAVKKAETRNYAIYSMNDESKYGKDFYELKFSEAISQGLLSDYKVVVLAVNENMISAAMQDAFSQDNEIQADDAVKIVGCWNALSKRFLNDNNWGLIGESYRDIKRRNPMQRAVAFSSTIAESKLIRSHFCRVIEEIISKEDNKTEIPLKCEIHHVDGKMNSLDRGKEIRWLKGEDEKMKPNECRILSNARCLSEGVDVPALDAVMFLKARKSEIDIVQSVGRVMRKPSDPTQKKEFGYIILPIVIESDVEPHEALNRNERYQVIWQVIQALRSHDDRLEAEIDKIPYTKKMPSGIVAGVIGRDDKRDSTTKEKTEEQLRFSFMQEWRRAIVAKLVLKCGDRKYLDTLALDVAKAFKSLSKRMENSLKGEGRSSYRSTLEKFLKSLRGILNDSITQGQAVEMLAMHSVTKPLFQALFQTKGSFTSQNPVSLSMDKALKIFSKQIEAETKELEKSYEDIKKRVNKIHTLEGRQSLIKELYQIVFKQGFPKMQKSLGIVYTPVEVVDFILESSNEILRREFDGKTLSSKNVKILDPFVGTGTFLTRLIENRNLIKDSDLKRKYNEEILSSEIVLLAYYIASVNIESSYHFRKKEIIKGLNDFNLSNDYERYKGAIFADTFQATENKNDEVESQFFQFFRENDEQRKRLQTEHIRVIIGNPPYSVGQKRENDNNKNLKYERLDEGIEKTYARDSKATLKKSLKDSYVRAIRWATDKINSNPKGGIVSFVTNGSFLDNVSMDGLRYHLAKDFTSLYIFNLRGNALTKGDERQKEGGSVFGEGSRCPIAISFLVKNPNKTNCEIYYYDIGDYLKQKEKLDKIKNFKNIEGIDAWEKIIPDENNDWLKQRDYLYKRFIPMGDRGNQAKNMFNLWSCGVKTNRDAWVYNFNVKELRKNVKKTINFYNRELDRYKSQKITPDIESFISNDSEMISWSGDMKLDLIRKKAYKYGEESLRLGLYRPFLKMYLYHNKSLNNSVYQTFKSYPKSDTKNLSICTSGRSAGYFSVLMVDITPNLDLLEKTQHFPRYTFQENMGKIEKIDNISKSIVKKFKTHYQDKSIDADKVFFYIYGLLHSKCYIKKYKNDLAKGLPRIPLVNDFHKFSKVGEKLSDLHVNYESKPKYKKLNVKIPMIKDAKIFRVEKMRHPKIDGKEDKSVIIYNESVEISEIPEKAYKYVVNGYSAIRWIIDRYRVKEDSKSKIVNDPNREDDPEYILNLLQKVIYVSMESVDLIESLPEITDWGETAYKDVSATKKKAKAIKRKIKHLNKGTRKKKGGGVKSASKKS